jgi:hypothetical protein
MPSIFLIIKLVKLVKLGSISIAFPEELGALRAPQGICLGCPLKGAESAGALP